jgi:hypothetical protein
MEKQQRENSESHQGGGNAVGIAIHKGDVAAQLLVPLFDGQERRVAGQMPRLKWSASHIG